MSLRFETRPAWGHANEFARRVARAACAELGAEGERFIKERMEAEGKKDTGLTSQSIRASAVEEVVPGVMRCVVATPPQQMTPAVVLEEGRKAGKGVSRAGRAKIAVWARRKAKDFVARLRAEMERDAIHRSGGERLQGKAVDRQKAAEERAAYIIAAAIKRRGLKAFLFFKRARDHVQGRAVGIQRQVLARLGAGGGR